MEEYMINQTFQRVKLTAAPQLSEKKFPLPELADPIQRTKLMKAYRRIEAEVQRRKQTAGE